MKPRKPDLPKTIEEELGIEGVEIELEDYDSTSKGQKEDIVNDYKIARAKILQSLTRGSEILDAATKSVLNDANARSIEVASKSLKELSETSKYLLELHELMKKFEDKNEKTEDNKESDKIKSNITKILKLVENK